MREGSFCASVPTVGLLGTVIVLLSPGQRKCGVSGLWLVKCPSQSLFSVYLTSYHYRKKKNKNIAALPWELFAG